MKNNISKSSIFPSGNESKKPLSDMSAEEFYHLCVGDFEDTLDFEDLLNDVKSALEKSHFVLMKRVIQAVHISWSRKFVMATVTLFGSSEEFVNVVLTKENLKPVFINHLIGPDTFFGDSYQLIERNSRKFSDETVVIKTKANRDVVRFDVTVAGDFFGFYYSQRQN